MVILTNEQLPFEIVFIVYDHMKTNNIRRKSVVKKFSTTSPINFIDDLIVREYDNLGIQFKSKENGPYNFEAKLYMDGLDVIDELEIDENEIPFISLNQKTMLHYHSNNNVSYPWIPGIYRLRVTWNNSEYYSQIIIEPNNLKINEHSLMIVDIEREAKGLARDWLRKSSSVNFFDMNSKIDPTFIDLANRILQNKMTILYNFNIIQRNIYKELIKDYQLTPIEKAKRMDNESLKLFQKRPNNQINGLSISSNIKIHSAIVKEELDNNINRYLVKIIYDFITIIKSALKDSVSLQEYVESEINNLYFYNRTNLNEGSLSKLKARQNQVKNINIFKKGLMDLSITLNQFLTNNKFDKMRSLQHIKIPKSIMKLVGYNAIFKIHQDLKNSMSNVLNDLYDYNWKSSEVLYEYWCFLRLIRILKGMNLEPIDGWIFSSEIKDRVLNIPSIPDDSHVIFEKGEFIVKLTFNSEVPRTPLEAQQKKSPYWIRANRNKPDFRLDVYHKNEYKHTIVLDAKYSPANRIWNKKVASYSGSNRTVEQLKIYANMIIKVGTRKNNVVEEVIALSPTFIDQDKPLQRDLDHLVSIATMKPGYDNSKLRELLQRLIFQL